MTREEKLAIRWNAGYEQQAGIGVGWMGNISIMGDCDSIARIGVLPISWFGREQ